MGTTADKLNKLLETKANIKQAIIDKGVGISDDTKFADYPSKIADIASGDDPVGPFYRQLTNNGTTYNYLFSNKTISDPSFIESLDTSNVTDMRYAFHYFTTSSLDLSGWDVSNVTKMNYMFNYANLSNLALDLSNWDISKVTSMSNMFADAKMVGINIFNTIPSAVTSLEYFFDSFTGEYIYGIKDWDVSNVKAFGCLFCDCSKLKEIDISGWDTSNGTSFQSSIYPIIYGCSNLERVIGVIDMSNNKTSLQYSATYALTKGCKKLKELRLVNIYKNTPVKNEAGYSLYLQDTQIEDQYLIEIIENLPDLINDKGLTDTSKLIIMLPPTNTLTEEQVQIAIDKGWTVANTTY